MRLRPPLHALALAAALPACGGGKPPIIDNLNMPSTVTLNATDNQFDVTGTISFHDDDDKVTTMRIIVPSAGDARFEFPVTPAPVQMVTDGPIRVSFVGSTPKGPIEYDVSLIDESSAVSDVKRETVTLQ
jgi:hypothetical protein